jgi:hypothetical protein
VRKRDEGAETPTKETQAASARVLVDEVGTRLAQLRAQDEVRQAEVDAVFEEIRREELLTRANLEKAAEAILGGENPLMMPPA